LLNIFLNQLATGSTSFLLWKFHHLLPVGKKYYFVINKDKKIERMKEKRGLKSSINNYKKKCLA